MIGTCIQMFLDSFLNSSLVAECEHSVQQAIAASASEVCVTKSKSFEVAPVVRPLQKSADVFTRCFMSLLRGTKDYPLFDGKQPSISKDVASTICMFRSCKERVSSVC
mgnify:CR=1 FL=1